MANQRTVKFLRSLSLKWCLPTFPFQGEITLVDSKKIPTFQGRVTGFGKNVQPYDNIRAEKVSFYFQIILWSWGFVTLCTDRVTSRPPQKKLDLVGNKPPPPGVSILMSFGENPHYVKLPIFTEFMENSAKFMKNSGLTKWTQNLR